jgi:5'-nucleotidase
MQRRTFLSAAAASAAALALPGRGWAADPITEVRILHTNDTHSRLDPFPMDGSRYEGLGGVARRKTLIDRIRRAHPHVLLVDAGDVFQGTPWFNLFCGKADYQAMNRMGYDVGILGNHEFDGGVPGLEAAMREARFDFVSSNYQFDAPALKARVKPWMVRELGPIRLGILGLGVAFEGLVSPDLHAGVRYGDVIRHAREGVRALRQEQRVDAVVALTHLALDDEPHSPGDRTLAAEVPGLDLIIGGHSHTFLDEPLRHRHADGRVTTITQAGFAGIWLGQATLRFEGKRLASVDAGRVVVA